MKRLSDEDFKATMASPTKRIPQDARQPFDFWRYFEQMPEAEFEGHDCRDGRVNYIWEMDGGRFRHVLIDSEDANVFMVLVLDCAAREVIGHRLLDLNREYGIEATPLIETRAAISREFEMRFRAWVVEALRGSIPGDVDALIFGLFEPVAVGCAFGVSLSGHRGFDPDSDDWFGEEVWRSAEELFIPSEYTLSDWDNCLERLEKLARQTLEEDSELAARLKQFPAVAVGFGEGNPSVVWRNETSGRRGGEGT